MSLSSSWVGVSRGALEAITSRRARPQRSASAWRGEQSRTLCFRPDTVTDHRPVSLGRRSGPVTEHKLVSTRLLRRRAPFPLLLNWSRESRVSTNQARRGGNQGRAPPPRGSPYSQPFTTTSGSSSGGPFSGMRLRVSSQLCSLSETCALLTG